MVKRYHRLRAASYLVLIKDGKVLMNLRAGSGFMDGYYSLPAGHVDSGETFTATMIREAKEEIGIDINPKNLEVVHVMHRKSLQDNIEYVDVFYVAKNWSGKIKNLELHKCADLSWFELGKLPKNAIPYIAVVLKKINKGVPYSEYGWQ